VDITATGITGAEAEKALEASGIIANKNAIPFDTRPPRISSGIRLGTPAVTSRGFGLKEMELIAQLIVRVLSNIGKEQIYREINQQVIETCSRFPMPGLVN
jgi:glycine hydroxymethyltransferase